MLSFIGVVLSLLDEHLDELFLREVFSQFFIGTELKRLASLNHAAVLLLESRHTKIKL